MRIIGRLIAVLVSLLAVVATTSAVAARAMKRHLARVDAPDADEVHLVAIFEPLLLRSTAASFRGGTIDSWYGGGLVDLREATLDPAGATIRVRAIFGGAHIVVPETWTVTSTVIGLGGVGDRRPSPSDAPAGPHLVIEGVALFGGVGITSEIPDAEIRGLEQAMAAQAARR